MPRWSWLRATALCCPSAAATPSQGFSSQLTYLPGQLACPHPAPVHRLHPSPGTTCNPTACLVSSQSAFLRLNIEDLEFQLPTNSSPDPSSKLRLGRIGATSSKHHTC